MDLSEQACSPHQWEGFFLQFLTLLNAKGTSHPRNPLLTVYPSPLSYEKIPILTCHHLVLLFEEILLGLMITEVYKQFKEIKKIAILKRCILYLTLNKVVENCIIKTGETNECWFTNYMEWQPCGCDTEKRRDGKAKEPQSPSKYHHLAPKMHVARSTT